MDQETKQILLRVKEKNPSLFKKKKVLEIGSLNLDQIEDFSIRSLFEDCQYTGVDINAGKDVDVVGHFGDVVSSLSGPYDFILCLNCLEHDIRWRETTIKALSLLKKGGHALFHTPSMLSDLHVVEHCKVNNVFKSREGSPDPYNPELYFKDVFFLKNKPGSQVETSETYKSQSGAFGIDQKLYWPNAPNYTIMFNAAIGANYEGVHSRVIWNASLQHNVHMTKPGEYYSNVSTGDFLELLAIHNLLLDYDIDVRIQRVLGLTFTALLRKKA